MLLCLLLILSRSGNGAKIIRCEISLDEGKVWRQADIKRFEKPNEHGEQGLHLREWSEVAEA